MKIAALVGAGFEDSEFRVPFERFLGSGHEVTVVGITGGEILKGDKGRERVTADRGIDDAHPEQFDALFIPGGHSPDKLRADERMVDFVRAFANKPIFAICHGPQLLITAGLVKGRTMTAWKTIQLDLQNAGATVVDQAVCVDSNFITSRKPEDLEAFCRESLSALDDAERTGNSATAHH